MSTDILNFHSGEQDVQTKGLLLYLKIAIPLTALTFLTWFFFYHWAAKKTFAFRKRADGDV
jgi:hypothetical protein